jgi:hypothetical protein
MTTVFDFLLKQGNQKQDEISLKLGYQKGPSFWQTTPMHQNSKN